VLSVSLKKGRDLNHPRGLKHSTMPNIEIQYSPLPSISCSKYIVLNIRQVLPILQGLTDSPYQGIRCHFYTQQ
jgi:hypothetical protein